MMLENTLQETPPTGMGAGGPPTDARRGDGGGPGREAGSDPTRFGLWAFLGTVSMLFIGFTSAYVVRRASMDWAPLRPPALLWVNTAVLAASSVALQRARRRLRGGELNRAQRWVALTGLLGALFVVGQLGAWRMLSAQGVYLASNPHSSFFYLLTGLHGLHLLGGLVWFAAVRRRLRALAVTRGSDALGLFATYWHFLGALWLYLLLLLFVL